MTAQITPETCEILITAEEAFCAFERAVLNAEARIEGGFRLFDMTTTLRSQAARAIGDTWFDLLRHKLDQGVTLTLKITDFDPVVRSDMHAMTWRTIRQGEALRELTRNPDALSLRAVMHGARVGWLSSIGLWAKSRGLVGAQAARHNALSPEAREMFRLERPGLMPLMRFDRKGRARARYWPAARLIPATHHHKLAVIDADQVYIGGLDLDDRRYDDKTHQRKAQETWHDLQLLVRDETLAKAARAHLNRFDDVTAGRAKPPAPAAPFLRTLSTARRSPVGALSPVGTVREIRAAHLDRIAAAREMIYLETQFLRDTDITAALCDAAARAPDLSLVGILPAAPEDLAFEGSTSSDVRYGEHLQATCVARLRAAFGTRLFLGAPVRPVRERTQDRSTLAGAPLIYVHAKLATFDHRAAIISSANLNGRSLNWDTEAGVALDNATLIRGLKRRCVAHWLPGRDIAPFVGGRDVAQRWQDLARQTAEAHPEARESFIVPYDVQPARRIGQNLPGVPEEMV